jgi:hypothetical protein
MQNGRIRGLLQSLASWPSKPHAGRPSRGAISLTVTGPVVVEARLVRHERAQPPSGGASLLLVLLLATYPLHLPGRAGLLPHQAVMHAYSTLPYARSRWRCLCAVHRDLAGRWGARGGETQARDNHPLTSMEHQHNRVQTGLAARPLLHGTLGALGRGSWWVCHGGVGEGREKRDHRLDWRRGGRGRGRRWGARGAAEIYLEGFLHCAERLPHLHFQG